VEYREGKLGRYSSSRRKQLGKREVYLKVEKKGERITESYWKNSAKGEGRPERRMGKRVDQAEGEALPIVRGNSLSRKG